MFTLWFPLSYSHWFSFHVYFSPLVCLNHSLHHIRWSSGEGDQWNYSFHFILNRAYFPSISSVSGFGPLSHINRVSSGLKTDQSISLLHPLPIQSHYFPLDFIYVSSCCVWMPVCLSFCLFFFVFFLSVSLCGLLCLASSWWASVKSSGKWAAY